jgi:IS605 OrfB family transposase
VALAVRQAGEVIGVDMNADHLAAWHLDPHGNPLGAPRTFGYDLDGTAQHHDAQVRHALTQLLHWATGNGVAAIAVEDLDFTDSKTREKHGRRPRFRQVISGMPTARLLAMATQAGIGVIAVDPAYTSKWGAQHWQKPLTAAHQQTTRHHAVSVAIGRRALGPRSGDGRHRRDHTKAMWPGSGPARPDPPPADASKPATPTPGHGHDPRHRSGRRTRATRRPNTVRGPPTERTHLRSLSRNGSEDGQDHGFRTYVKGNASRRQHAQLPNTSPANANGPREQSRDYVGILSQRRQSGSGPTGSCNRPAPGLG